MMNDCLHEILRTRWLIAAAKSRATDEVNHGRNDSLVEPQEETDQGFHEVWELNIPARKASFDQSCFNSVSDASPAFQRAITTKSHPGLMRT